MDQEKIGSFIALCRKKKKLTQEQLALKLGVTDRAISNWENGKNMPDLSLFEPLCEILGISISELIAGEKLSTDNLEEKDIDRDKDLTNNKKVNFKLLIIISLFLLPVLFFIIDFLCIFLWNKPLFAIEGNSSNMYSGLFYDTYICPEYNNPKIKMKGTKFSCSEKFVYKIETDLDKNMVKKPKLYYEVNGQRVYTSCLDKIYVNLGNEKIELYEYLEKEGLSFDEITKKLNLDKVLDDGGTKIYRDDWATKFTNNGLTLVKCNRKLEDGTTNKDIYISPVGVDIKDNYCTNDYSTFTRYYKLSKSIGGDAEFSYYLTLSEFQGVTDTVLVHNIFEELEEGKHYEFEFKRIPSSKNIPDDIDSIFSNTEIISIKETDKRGLQQISGNMS